MQIFEVTKNKKVNEGIMGQLGRIGAATMAKTFTPSSLTVDPNLKPKTVVAPGQRGLAAGQYNMAQVKPLADKGSSAWLTTLQKAMADAQPPAVTPAALDKAELDELAWATIDSMIGFRHTDLQKNPSPEAKIAFDNLVTGHDELIQASMQPKVSAATLAPVWQDLAADIISGMTAQEFGRPNLGVGIGGSGGAGGLIKSELNPASGEFKINGRKINPSDPSQASAIASIVSALTAAGVKI